MRMLGLESRNLGQNGQESVVYINDIEIKEFAGISDVSGSKNVNNVPFTTRPRVCGRQGQML